MLFQKLPKVKLRVSIWPLTLWFCSLGISCTDSSESPEFIEPAVRDSALPTWAEFKAAAARNTDGHQYFLVDWDIPVASEEELRVIYDAKIQKSTVNRTFVGGRLVDDIWSHEEAQNLVYCVSDEFGAYQEFVIGEMATAASDWEAVADVRFRYAPRHDSNCHGDNRSVLFAVRPWDDDGACAFFPSGGGCVPNTLVINLFTDFPGGSNVRTVGVLRHELGHILGLRHEHINQPRPACSEGGYSRQLTQYDPESVMHYPWCDGVRSSDLSITALDARGVAELYGAPRVDPPPREEPDAPPGRVPEGEACTWRLVDRQRVLDDFLQETSVPIGSCLDDARYVLSGHRIHAESYSRSGKALAFPGNSCDWAYDYQDTRSAIDYSYLACDGFGWVALKTRIYPWSPYSDGHDSCAIDGLEGYDVEVYRRVDGTDCWVSEVVGR